MSRIPLYLLTISLLALPARTVCAASTDTAAGYDENQMLIDLGRESGGVAGTFGQASGYLASIAHSPEKVKFVSKWIAENQTLAGAIQGSGGGQLDAAALETFLKGGEDKIAAAALLFDSAKNPRRLAKLMEEYKKHQADGKVTDFSSFLDYMAKDWASPPGEGENADERESIITRVLTASEAAPAPEEEGVRPGEGEDGQTGPQNPEHQRSFWNTDELFGKKGDINVFDVDGHIITMNITTSKSASGAKTEQLTICDRTPTADITCKSFSLEDTSLRAGIEFQLDDREGSVNEMKFKLQFVPEGDDKKIVFGHGDTALGEGMTIGNLFKHRAQKIRDYGYIVKIGGKEFYVGGEAHGSVGQNTFWSKEQLDKQLADEKFDPRDLVPDMVAVAVVRAGGRDVPVPESSIGQVDGKWYNLRWDKEKGQMEVVEGLPPGIPPVGPGGGYDGPSEDDGTGVARYGPGPHEGWPDMTKVGLVLHESLNSKLAPEVLEKIRFYYSADAEGTDQDPKLSIMFSKDAAKRTGLIYLGRPADKQDHVELIVPAGKENGYVLATQGTNGMLYLDLRREIGLASTPQGTIFNFDTAIVGRFLTATRTFEEMKDPDALGHALQHAEFGAEDVRTILLRLNERASGKAFTVSGGKQAVEVQVKEGEAWKKYQLWPKDEPVEGGQPTDGEVAESGFILDQPTVRTAEALPKEPPRPPGVPDGENVTVAYAAGFTEQKDARVIVVEDKEKKTKKWFLYFMVEHPDRSMTFPPVQIFEDPPTDRYPLPGGLKVGGVGLPAKVEKPDEYARGFKIGTPLKRRNDELPAKGWVAVYDSEAANIQANCVDVVLWWGYPSRDAARSECKYADHSLRKAK